MKKVTEKVPSTFLECIAIFVASVLMSFSVFAQTEPSQFMSVDGRLYDSANPTNPLLDNSVQLQIQVLNPAKTCILYEEQQTVSTLSSNGYFNVRVGSPNVGPDSVKRSANDSGNNMATVFQNQASPVTGKTSSGIGCSYTPAQADTRYFRFIVTPSTTGVTSQLSPDMTVDSVPQSLVAESLQGLAPDDFIRVNANTTQAKADSLFGASYTTLTNLLGGTSTLYLQNSASGTVIPNRATDPVAPTDGQIWFDTVANQFKYYDGATIQTLSTGGGDPSKLPLAGGTMTGDITMGGNQILGVGHITQMNQSTITIGRYTNVQEATLVGTPLTVANKGLFWFNSDTNELKYWDGAAAQTVASLASAGDITAVNTNAGSGLSGGVLTGAATLQIVVDSTGIEINGSNQLQIKDSGVTNAKIADNAVTTNKIIDDAVTTAKILNSNVTDAKIAGVGVQKIASGAGNYFTYAPNNNACTNGEILVKTANGWECGTDATGVSAHSALTGLTTGDDHTQYVLLAGRAGGQTLNGGTAASEDLTIDSTSNGAKGDIILNPTGGRVGIGSASPTHTLDIYGTAKFLTSLQGNDNGAAYLKGTAINGISDNSIPYSFNGSTATGFSSTGANTGIRIVVNASEKMRVEGDNVGIGTTTPASKLDVEGTIQIGDGGEACSLAANAGMIKYAAGALQYCNGSAWQTLGVSGSGLTTLNGQTGSTQTFAVGATGTAPAWSSATDTHTLNIPLASGVGVTSGTITKAEYDSFVAKLSAVTGSTLNSARIWIGDGSNQAQPVLMSGDATLSNTGVLTIANDAITTTKILDANVTDAKIATVGVQKIASGAGNYLTYAPNNVACSNGDILVKTANGWECGTDATGVTDHGLLAGLSDDDHTQYVLLAGRTGGQTLVGGTAASEDLTLDSTSNGTKGDIFLNPNGGNVGIGTTTPSARLNVVASGATDGLNVQTAGGNLIYDQYGNFQTPYGLRAGGFAFFQRMADADNGFNRLLVGSNVSYDPSINVYDVTPNAAFDRAAIEFLNGGTISFITDAVDRSAGSTLTPAQWNALTKMVIRPSGNVGIGTLTPASKLDVEGTIQIGDGGETCSSGPNAGMIRYNGGALQYCNGSAWQTLGVSGSGLTTLNGQTGNTQTFAVGISGTAPAWSSATDTHTLNIPLASGVGVTSGTITKAEYDSFVAKLSAVAGSSLTSGRIWVGDGANQAQAVLMSGDATLSNTGALTIANDAITSAKIAADTIAAGDIATGAVTTDEILDGTIAAGDLASDAVTTAKILNSNVTDEKIATVGVQKIASGAGNYFTYAPNNVACSNGQILVKTANGWECGTDATGSADHGVLTGLLDDDHTQYVLLAGRSGGQTLNGGTAASEDLTIDSTANATKGDVLINPAGGRVGIGTTNPLATLDVRANGTGAGTGIRLRDTSAPGAYFLDIQQDGNTSTINSNGAYLVLTSNYRNTYTAGGAGWAGAHTFNTAAPMTYAGGNHAFMYAPITWAPTVGSGSFAAISIVPTINQTGSATGDYSAIQVDLTETAALGANRLLLDLKTNGSRKFVVTSDGNVGIGTTTPASKLDVEGTIQIGDGGETCSSGPNAGMLRYSAGVLQYCNGSAWQTLGVSGSGLTTLNGQTGSTQTFAVGVTGTAPAFSSATNTHTLNIPLASGVGVTSGTITKTEYDSFVAKLSAVAGSSLTSGRIWVGDGANLAQAVQMSGDATLSNTGALTIANDAVTTAKILNSNVTDAKIATVGVQKIASGAGDYFTYAPNNLACTNGQILVKTANGWECGTDATGVSDHGLLSGLTDDDHTQYVLLAGRAGGQTLNGGTAASEDLTIDSTSNVTKGDVLINPTGGNVGIGTNAPSNLIHGRISDAVTNTVTNVLRLEHESTGTPGASFGTGLLFTGESTTTANREMAQIDSIWTTATDASRASALRISTLTGGGALTEKMRIDGAGNVGIGTTGPWPYRLEVRTSDNEVAKFTSSANPVITIDRLNTGGETNLYFTNNGALQGRLATVGNSSRLIVDAESTEFRAITGGHSNAVIDYVGLSGRLRILDKTNGSSPIAFEANGNSYIAGTGNLGIGTTTPASKLDVEGTIQIGDGGETCSSGPNAGMIRYSAGVLQYCNGSSWQTLGVSGSGLTTLNGQTGSTQTFAVGSTGTAPAWSSATNTHTLNIPLASGVGVTSGTITKTEYDSFVAKLSAVTGSTLNSARIWVGDGANQAQAVLMSGDATLSNTGALTIANDAITTTKILNSNVTDEKIATVGVQKIASGAGNYFTYAPNNNACTNGQILVKTANGWECGTDATGSTDHGALTGLGDDDHTQYVMLAGRAGGQILRGGTAASDDLTLESTSNVTKGDVLINPTGGNVGVGTSAPSQRLEVSGNIALSPGGDRTISIPAPSSGSGNKLTISAGAAAPGNAGGGDLVLEGGIQEGFSDAGAVYLKGGAVASSNGNGGSVFIQSASGGGNNGRIAGNISVIAANQGGSQANNLPGSLIFNAGSSIGTGAAPGGAITMSAGTAGPSGTGGVFTLTSGAGGSSGVANGSGGLFSIQGGAPGSGGGTAGSYGPVALQASGGNVGIGTTVPGTLLDVAGAITARPTGAGAGQTGQILLRELAVNGTKTVTLRSPDAINTASYALTLPVDAGTSGQVLQTDGNGILSWVTAPVSGGNIAAGAGTAGAPSLSFSGDTNTGFYSSAADTIAVSTNSAKIFDISSAGIVSATTGGGLVTTANGTAGAPTFSFSGDEDTGWWRPAADTMAASTGGAEIMRIDSAGLVGIGTTAPVSKLHVTGGALTIGAQNEIRFRDADESNYMALRAANDYTSDFTLTLPSFAPNAGEVLSSDASGNMTWIAQSAPTQWTNDPNGQISYTNTNTSTPSLLSAANVTFNASTNVNTDVNTPQAALFASADKSSGTGIQDQLAGARFSATTNQATNWLYGSQSLASAGGGATVEGVVGTLSDAKVDWNTNVGTGSSASGVYGILNTSRLYINSTTPDVYGISNTIDFGWGSSATRAWGLRNILALNGGSYDTAYGTVNDIRADWGAIVTTAYGTRTSFLASGSTIGTAYGSYLDMTSPWGGAIGTAYGSYISLNGTNTATQYGVYVTNLGNSASNYAFYADGSAKSYFGGNVGIGTTTPGTLLDVAGAITARPTGTGTGQTGQLLLRELAVNGTKTVTLRSPDAINTASYALTLPVDDGTSGQVLQTDGNGILSWVTALVSGGTFTAGAGTAGAPSLSFSGDSNTGFYSSAGDTIGVSANSTKIFDISSAGIVSATTGGGLVTTANGTAGAPTYSFSGDANTGMFRQAEDVIAFATGGVQRFRINSTGNTYLYATDASIYQMVENLSSTVARFPGFQTYNNTGGVGGYGTFSNYTARGSSGARTAVLLGDILGSFQSDGYDGAAYGGGAQVQMVAEENYSGTNRGTYLNFLTTNLGATSATAKMRITANGNVGIGTTTPAARLDVSSSGVNSVMQLHSSSSGYTSTDGFEISTGGSGYAWLWNYENSAIDFGTNNTSRMIISSAGNVGIGTNNPTSRLELSSDAKTAVTVRTFSANANDGAEVWLYRARGTAAAPTYPLNADRIGFFGASNAINNAGWSGMFVFATENQTATAQGSQISFVTVPNGTTTSNTAMLINQNGNVGIGTSTPAEKLTVNGNMQIGTQTTRTTATNRGQLALSSTYTVTVNANTTLDWNNGNIQEINTFACNNARTITMNNMKDGAAYTLLLSGTAAHSGNCLFAATGKTFRTSGGNIAPTTARDVLFTFVVINNTVVFTMTDDLQ